MGTRDPLPHEAVSAAEFVDCLRQLKEQAGLTLRQLEANARQGGDVLARSTVADMLRRDSLPRPETVRAFVRACGRGAAAADWVEARNRLARAEPPSSPATVGESASASGVLPSDGLGEPPVGRAAAGRGVRGGVRAGWGVIVAGVGVVLLVAGVVVWVLVPGGRGGGADSLGGGAGASSVLVPLPGLTRIRSAVDPRLCVSEGHDREGRYRSEIAVQRDCAGAAPPDVSLVPVGRAGSFFIQWSHPVHGNGCLTALGSGHVVEGLFEPWPWESCSADRTSQHFFFEPVGRSPAQGFRIRVVINGMCLGANGGDDHVEGAEIAQQRCTGAAGQTFLVDTAG
ncbi:RICIN domain-containing protein [Kitasatospora purpeofusca]|uniref:RICIN domain-containing protein n=1 Tax=Kitasatospora purpeofusca TaxID=67352 RepID=UPI0004BEFFA5|nr:RICIN domain-containing protein [Kitasatospora purpeofusca]